MAAPVQGVCFRAYARLASPLRQLKSVSLTHSMPQRQHRVAKHFANDFVCRPAQKVFARGVQTGDASTLVHLNHGIKAGIEKDLEPVVSQRCHIGML